MKNIAITQRVVIVEAYRERRDAIDQQWVDFFIECEFCPILVPNHLYAAERLIEKIPIKGIVFTGGNDLSKYGGDAPERDQTENMLLKYALENNIPLLGICRGMQVIQDYYGIQLERIEGHVKKKQNIYIGKKRIDVNSYHEWGTTESQKKLKVWAQAEDGIVKGILHEDALIQGIMWHPERFSPFRKDDIDLFQGFFQ